MMSMGWGFFPWPVLFVVPVMVAMIVFMALRSGLGRGGMGPGCGFGSPPSGNPGPTELPAPEDPMVTLRERYVRGDIGTDEFERRLDGLLRSDPTKAMPWLNK